MATKTAAELRAPIGITFQCFFSGWCEKGESLAGCFFGGYLPIPGVHVDGNEEAGVGVNFFHRVVASCHGESKGSRNLVEASVRDGEAPLELRGRYVFLAWLGSQHDHCSPWAMIVFDESVGFKGGDQFFYDFGFVGSVARCRAADRRAGSSVDLE